MPGQHGMLLSQPKDSLVPCADTFRDKLLLDGSYSREDKESPPSLHTTAESLHICLLSASLVLTDFNFINVSSLDRHTYLVIISWVGFIPAPGTSSWDVSCIEMKCSVSCLCKWSWCLSFDQAHLKLDDVTSVTISAFKPLAFFALWCLVLATSCKVCLEKKLHVCQHTTISSFCKFHGSVRKKEMGKLYRKNFCIFFFLISYMCSFNYH